MMNENLKNRACVDGSKFCIYLGNRQYIIRDRYNDEEEDCSINYGVTFGIENAEIFYSVKEAEQFKSSNDICGGKIVRYFNKLKREEEQCDV